MQQHNGRPVPAALELTGKARELADIKKCKVTAVCPGKGSGFEKELFEAGADEVIFYMSENMEDTDDDAYARILIPLIKERKPETVGKTFEMSLATKAMAQSMATVATVLALILPVPGFFMFPPVSCSFRAKK